MNRLGMIIDGAHSSNKTVENAAEISTAPIVISHSGTYGVHTHHAMHRSPDQGCRPHRRTHWHQWHRHTAGNHENQIEALVAHINHVSNLVGETHVAIGLDHLYFANQFDEFMQNQRITHPESYAQKAGKAQNWKSLEPEAISGSLNS